MGGSSYTGEDHTGSVRRGRIAEIDALRGIAAVGVVLFHFFSRKDLPDYDRMWFHAPWGRFGVQLFFIISGYVIFMTVLRSRSLMDFVVSRFARLFPAYWLACVLTYTIVRVFDPAWNPITLKEAAFNLFMVKIPGVHMPYVEGVYWTLRQEMYFYIVIGLVLAAGYVHRAQAVMAGLVLAALCTLAWSKWFSLFLIGMVLFDSREMFRVKHGILLAICGADILRRAFWGNKVDTQGLHYVGGVAVCALLVFWVTRRRIPWLTNRVLLFLGDISYSLYLVHASIGLIIIKRAMKAGVSVNLAILLAIACMMLLAIGMTFGIEKPAGRAIRGWYARRRRSGEPVVGESRSAVIAAPGASEH